MQSRWASAGPPYHSPGPTHPHSSSCAVAGGRIAHSATVQRDAMTPPHPKKKKGWPPGLFSPTRHCFPLPAQLTMTSWNPGLFVSLVCFAACIPHICCVRMCCVRQWRPPYLPPWLARPFRSGHATAFSSTRHHRRRAAACRYRSTATASAVAHTTPARSGWGRRTMLANQHRRTRRKATWTLKKKNSSQHRKRQKEMKHFEVFQVWCTTMAKAMLFRIL